jgi:hypothetical protein
MANRSVIFTGKTWKVAKRLSAEKACLALWNFTYEQLDGLPDQIINDACP